MKSSIKILAIESSCDDTAASVIIGKEIVSNVIADQKVHALYGGVVPELASRNHQVNIIPAVDTALKNAGVGKEELDAIAVVNGPGLLGSLIVGVTFAKTLAAALGLPLIEINHHRAHIMALFIDDPVPAFPFLALTVSGGHTQISIMKNFRDIEVIGRTLDDAAGEAFDKTGKLFGLDYPAGPVIDRLSKLGKPVFEFPEPKIEGLDFSFSGLKTSILYFVEKKLREDPDFVKNNINDLCASVQDRIVSILMNKVIKAAQQTGIKEIGIAGGVSANSGLRTALTQKGREAGWKTYVPRFEYCTDNAAMVAITAYYKFLGKDFADFSLNPKPRYSVD
ncbi:MAG: tRNA (adenosine(37)-N6)-threonylcarbamoyltransferase complex transferase subunit TsaD [Saprospiraceae bacterium]|nr:tRNA (adenosine(37)-N6)-threonylcarbamoyltransferase complex transferase subunit TsaD [Saprospiraceae bacterium]